MWFLLHSLLLFLFVCSFFNWIYYKNLNQVKGVTEGTNCEHWYCSRTTKKTWLKVHDLVMIMEKQANFIWLCATYKYINVI